MNLVRIDPPIHLLTPLGPAEAHFLQAPFGSETHATFCCFQDETKECWWWPNPLVRLVSSVTGWRDAAASGFHLTPEYIDTLRPHVARHTRSPLRDRI